MGADNFVTRGRGKTVAEAFSQARDEALYESGHGGYTGTIAEKHEYREFVLPTGVTPQQFIRWVEEADDAESFDQRARPAEAEPPAEHRALVLRAVKVWQDKWGPAVAVRIAEDAWVFFGLASS